MRYLWLHFQAPVKSLGAAMLASAARGKPGQSANFEMRA
jgi:hypothetical protein